MKKKYDIALSFAGEDRNYVSKVASLLKKRGVNVFYDEYEQANLWGKNLYDHLAEIYSKQAKYVIIFISKHYAKKAWTNHERKSSQAKALIDNNEYILPARFDDVEIPGLPNTVGYIDLRKIDEISLVEIVCKKLNITEDKVENAKILITRINRSITLKFHPLFIENNRNNDPVEIEIDGEKTGKILGGETKEFSVVPGIHYISLQYKHFWVVINRLYETSSHEMAEKTVGSTFEGGKTYKYSFKIVPDSFAHKWSIELQ